MQQGISNFETEWEFNEVNNEGLNDSILGVYPSDKIHSFK